ncbi:MAG TPA: hypothetical protein VD772_05790 [Anseongella sp.]|nr:hypothetical protein [Anseongella sp.]
MQAPEKEFPVTGREGAPIDLETATRWTRNYRQMRPQETISHFFGRTHYEALLDQEGCMGIRIYYANSLTLNPWQRFILRICNFLRKSVAGAEGEEHLILVGSDREGKDQLPAGKPGKSKLVTDAPGPAVYETAVLRIASDRQIIEQSNPCPGSPGCPKNSLTGG